MIKYFDESELYKSSKQKKKCLAVYYMILALYLAFSAFVFIYYFNLPYQSEKVSTCKFILYTLTVLFVFYSFIWLGIVFKRIKRYNKQCKNLVDGLKETTVASFIEYDNEIHNKDGVDFKSLIFLEWNKYKKDYYERKVLVFYEKPFPKIPEKSNVKFITQGNVLIEYEILD